MSVQRARKLVLKYGWNATAYQIVNPGITHWFSSSGDAMIGYVRKNHVRVVAGAPVCDGKRTPKRPETKPAILAPPTGSKICWNHPINTARFHWDRSRFGIQRIGMKSSKTAHPCVRNFPERVIKALPSQNGRKIGPHKTRSCAAFSMNG